MVEKVTDNPMRRGRLNNGNPGGDPESAPRCGAKTRAGTPCRQAAMRGRLRCRIHGDASTGAHTADGLARMQASKVRHGPRTKEMQELRLLLRALRNLEPGD